MASTEKALTVVITGVSSGIGRATLHSLLWQGYTVFGRQESQIMTPQLCAFKTFGVFGDFSTSERP